MKKEDQNIKKLIKVAERVKTIGVRANCDSAKELTREVEGIGLCRTEHMFFGKKRIHKFRSLIL